MSLNRRSFVATIGGLAFGKPVDNAIKGEMPTGFIFDDFELQSPIVPLIEWCVACRVGYTAGISGPEVCVIDGWPRVAYSILIRCDYVVNDGEFNREARFTIKRTDYEYVGDLIKCKHTQPSIGELTESLPKKWDEPILQLSVGTI